MTTERVDKILEVIDDGQRTIDPYQHSIGGRVMPSDETCWRCTRHKPTEGLTLCDSCRAWMCCTSDDDPCSRMPWSIGSYGPLR